MILCFYDPVFRLLCFHLLMIVCFYDSKFLYMILCFYDPVILKAVTRQLLGAGCIFICSCSAQIISVLLCFHVSMLQ